MLIDKIHRFRLKVTVIIFLGGLGQFGCTTHSHVDLSTADQYKSRLVHSEDLKTIRWHPERPLTWSDFTAPVPVTKSNKVANIRIAIAYQWKHRTRCDDAPDALRLCVITVNDILLEAYFVQNKSWVNHDKIRPNTLAHEQLHFDIAEVTARVMRRDLIKYLGRTAAGIAKTDVLALKDAQNRFAISMRLLIRLHYNRFKLLQNTYEAQTDAGRNIDWQNEWERHIADLLRRLDPI